MGRTVSILMLCLLAICVLAFPGTHIAPVYAAATTVAVTNAITGSNVTVAKLHSNFTLNVTIENSPANLAGYQFTLVWNASILNCTSYTVTPPQEWGSNVFIGRDQLNRTNPDGTQSYFTVVTSTLFGVNTGPNHIVNTFNFTVIGTEETTLTLRNVVLGDYYAHGIPVTVISGLFETLFSPIHIQVDGSIYPSSAPIQRNGSIYTFTGNITSSASGIIVQKSNITIDGAGYTIRGSEAGYGFNLTSISNTTIRNTKIGNFSFGIWLNSSSNHNSIFGNRITANYWGGIAVSWFSNNNVISGNNIANNGAGIYLDHNSSYNTVSGNNITSSFLEGVRIETYSSNEVVSGNNIANNGLDGVLLFSYSSNDTISKNNITANLNGLMFTYANNCVISGNSIRANNGTGIFFEGLDSNNSLSGNNITLNKDEGIVVESSSDYNSISGNCIANSGNGILFSSSSNNIIIGNNITNNENGTIFGRPRYAFTSCSHNIFSGNNVTNSRIGIVSIWASNNSIYHNNFVNNTSEVYSSNSTNVWDNGYPSGGNYWSNYTGKDLFTGPYQNVTTAIYGSDGIGDTPHTINSNNTDNYPLMGMFHQFSTFYGQNVGIVSNSSISDFSFRVVNSTAALIFNVTGMTGTHGFCLICIPRALMNYSFSIVFDGKGVEPSSGHLVPTLYENYTYVYINYTHSEHTIEITGTTPIIPEFPSFLIMPLMMMAMLLAVMVCRRKHDAKEISI